MIPLMLDVSELKVLLFGAGKVGLRKVRAFDGCKSVTVVSRSIPEGFCGKAEDVADIPVEDLIKLINEHDVVITALPDKVLNKNICAIAKSCSKLFNSSDGDGNFMLPAVFREGDFTLAVSTNGKAPAVPKFVRDRVSEEFKYVDEMIVLESELRSRLKEICSSQAKRADVLERVLEDKEIWGALPDLDKARALAEKYLI